MTNEAQRIAIAEACEWKNVKPLIVKNVAFDGDDRLCGITSDNGWIPDYLNDLNAMHEAEKALDEQNQWNYGNTLALMVLSKERAYFGEESDAEPNLNGLGHFALATITAAQRAEAFLRTLHLWKD